MKIRLLFKESFRAGQHCQLMEWTQLLQETKELLGALENDTEIYGVFLPQQQQGATAKVAYRETAMLYLHLQQAETLPHYFTATPSYQKNETIARLVLDGIIEIKWKGKFVSGTAATAAIFGGLLFDETTPPNHVAALSMQAIQYVWELPYNDVAAIAAHLYAFNTIVWDAGMKETFMQKNSIRQFLFPGIDIATGEWPGNGWLFSAGAEKKGWLSWMRPLKQNDDFSRTYKLYISPLIEQMPAVIKKAIPVINISKAISFKTGSNLHGQLRPDKMIVYFTNMKDLMEVVELLKKELHGFAAQGVPFTSQLNDTGLLSYGIDPPVEEVLEQIEGGSWRTAVTDRLAVCIAQTKRDGLNWPQSLLFIKAGLLTDSIDPINWEPLN
jgi:hypothetical protein